MSQLTSTTPTQAGSWTDVPSAQVDALTDAQSAQNAWSDEEPAPASASSLKSSSVTYEGPTSQIDGPIPSFPSPVSEQTDRLDAHHVWGDGKPALASSRCMNLIARSEIPSRMDDSCHSPTISTEQTEQTDATSPTTPPAPEAAPEDEEEFGDFVSASTDPFKQPIFNATEDIDETLTLLTSRSVPECRTGIFAGNGLVEPVRARFDNSTRSLRQVGKSALHNFQMVRWEKRVKIPAKEKVPVGGGARMNGVVRPVSFAKPRFDQREKVRIEAIDSMMEEEKRVWVGPSGNVEMP